MIQQTSQLSQFTKIEFIFNPKKTDTLSTVAKKYIGFKMIGMVGWVQESGMYKDQTVIVDIDYYTENINEFIGWIPEEDCDQIKELNSCK